ncbi:MAG: hypothetical protein HY001_02930 [Candidatus Portnoybacteria bacterium]|nr:hypothetical protein [Candidatus Portnoybacteria bacterium]
MRKDYEKLFTHLEPPEPPAEFFAKIMARIHEEERPLSIKRRLFLFSTTVLISAGALIPIVNAFQSEFAQSGLFQFLSLLFYDLRSVVANWQDFGSAILESLPATTLMAFMITMLVLLWSLKHLAQAIKIVFHSPQLINS